MSDAALRAAERGDTHHGTEALYAGLRADFPELWEGCRGKIRHAYASLRRRLKETNYPLVSAKGLYGFECMLKTGQGPGVSVVLR